MIKDVFFNELSSSGGSVLCYREIESLRELYWKLYEVPEVDFVCRIDAKTLANMVKSIEAQRNGRDVMSFLYGFLRPPFEGDSSEDDQSDYLESQWKCGGKECFGLAMASILDTLAISIDRVPWNMPSIQISRDTSCIVVRNCSRVEHVDAHGDWVQSLVGCVPVTCCLPPENKQLRLREDHGMDVLHPFAKRLLESEYVIGVVNSLPFNPKFRRFVRVSKADGIVHLVLYWTDLGYGLAVQTTGRNLRETEEIARRLEAEYGHAV